MRRRHIVLSVLLLAVLSVLPSAEVQGGGESAPVYRSMVSSELNIRAYKNTPDPIRMTIFDALTGKLEEIGPNQMIDIYPYIAKFLSNNLTSSLLKPAVATDPTWAIADKDKVLFSYLVSGSSTGTFTLEVTLGSFYRTDVPPNTPDQIIAAHYELGDMAVGFPSAGGAQMLGDNEIAFLVRPTSGVEPQGRNDGKLSVRWTVTNNVNMDYDKTQDFWTSEGVVLMALDKSQYDNASAGNYKADVIVHLKVE